MISTKSSPRLKDKASSSPPGPDGPIEPVPGVENEELARAEERAAEQAAEKRAKRAKPKLTERLAKLDVDRLLTRQSLDLDLLSQLTHMSAVSTSGMERAKLFEGTGNLSYSTSKYFRQVHLVAQRLKYDYSRACEVVADTIKEESVRSLLLHFATALSSGESEEQFLMREAELLRETYGKEYERKVETLQKWSDAYVALMVSATLIVVISLVSMMIYPFSPLSIIGLAGLMVCITLVGGWLIFTVAPIEPKTHTLKQRSQEQDRMGSWAKILLPLAAIAGAGAGWFLGLGPALAITGVIIAPIGVMAMMDDWRLDKKDRDIATFIRALGSVMGAANITAANALSRLNRRALGSMEPGVRRLYIRLKNGVSPDLSWLRLAAESGSEIVVRCVRIFWDGIRVGGDPEKVSVLASDFALKIHLLRLDRKLVSTTFSFVAIPLHAVLIGILLFITEVVQLFGSQLSGLQDQNLEGGLAAEAGVGSALLFAAPALDFVPVFVGTVVLMLTAANAFAPYAASGGHKLKLCLYAAIMMVISGVAIMLVPAMVGALFSSVSDVPTIAPPLSPTS